MTQRTVHERRLLGGRLAAVLATACCRLALAGAPDTEASALHLSGFGTLGLVHSDAPAGWGFRRDNTQRANDGGTRGDIDTRLGLQASYRATPQVELVGQVLIANRVADAPVSDAVTLAFAAWRPTDDLTVRAGRLSTDYFLIPEYRNVGFAYPFVRPPVDSYGGVPLVLDGVDLTKVWRADDTVWKLRGISGRSELSGDGKTRNVVLRPVYALVLSRDDTNGLLVKASVARLRLRIDATPLQPLLTGLGQIGALPVPEVAARARGLAASVAVDGQAVSYYSLGMGFDRDAWLASVEVSRAQPDMLKPYNSVWALLGYRWGAFTGYGVASATRWHGRESPPEWTAALTPVIGAAAAAQAQQLGNIAFAATSVTAASQHTVALGLRWDFADRTALKLQWDRVHVLSEGGQLWAPRTGDAMRAYITSVTLDFVF